MGANFGGCHPMSHVFISYGRSTEAQAHAIADALRSRGFEVWRDDEIPANRAYSEVIEERLKSAKAVVVVWSAEAAKSHWVRAEADQAREAGTLIQVTVDGTLPPLPFNQIQCADLSKWAGDLDSDAWKKVEAAVASLVGESDAGTSGKVEEERRFSICVLPFINMSGDPEQEYFSDGITEDIITDLSQISALSVVARNTSFSFKGSAQHVTKIARELNVTHVLEGSVRKAGGRVRINAQLIDGVAGDHIWAQRYDRDLTDIFEIQDEISKAIVDALEVKLLPKEKKAIEHRGTSSAEAYNLYLMAREHWITGSYGDARRAEMVIRICSQATALDPSYARAWALMALAQTELRFWHGRSDDGLTTAERTLALDPNIAEAHCVRARYLAEEGRFEEADAHIASALRLDPESWEANHDAGMLIFRQGRITEATPYFEKAASLMDTDYHSHLMLTSCYRAGGDLAAAKRSSQSTIDRAEKVVAQDPMNGGALTAGGSALATLGEMGRAREWIDRAMLVAPDDLRARYNLACALAAEVNDSEGALKLLGPYFEKVPTMTQVKHADVDPDLDPIRRDPRFEKMIADAKARLGAGEAIAAQ
jgi:adenylate cyclase